MSIISIKFQFTFKQISWSFILSGSIFDGTIFISITRNTLISLQNTPACAEQSNYILYKKWRDKLLKVTLSPSSSHVSKCCFSP